MNTSYLVGVVRQKCQGCGNAALGCQQAGVLTHLLGQKSPDSVRVHGLGELHSFAEDDNFLNQILNQKSKGEGDIRDSNTYIKDAGETVTKLPKFTRSTAPILSLLEEHTRAEHHLDDNQQQAMFPAPTSLL